MTALVFETDELTMLEQRRAAMRAATACCREERLRAARLREERLFDGADRLTGRIGAAMRALGRNRHPRRGGRTA